MAGGFVGNEEMVAQKKYALKPSTENNTVWGDGSRTVVAVITIVAVSLIVSVFYGPFVNNFFAFDDFRYIENLFSTPTALLFGYNSTRFLSNLVFSPLFELSGYNPAGYNLFNMIMHGLNSLLLPRLTPCCGSAPATL